MEGKAGIANVAITPKKSCAKNAYNIDRLLVVFIQILAKEERARENAHGE